MSSIPLPLKQFSRHQEDLIWLAAESDGAMGRKSNQGAIQARLEGGGGSYATSDILEDPIAALEEVTKRASFRAATRAKVILRTYKMLEFKHQEVLAAAYWTPLQRGLEAWNRLANLVVISSVANKKFKISRSRLSFGEWMVNLSVRMVGVLGRDGMRSRPKATSTEQKIIISIERDCEQMLRDALVEYSRYSIYVAVSNV